ncbi:MAG: alpha/beta hydrolase, partial [Abditibacteriota bacterium]|nr:alpha/beta hydrolase [Abditibacteriota bacterium]
MMKVNKHDEYIAVPGGRRLRLIVYEPSERGEKMPAMVSMHSGYWMEGSADDNEFFSAYLAEQGFVVFDVDYRLSPEARWPAQIEDCKTAVRYIRADCRRYGIDPDRILAAGFSAGGMLANLLGVLPPGTFEGSGRNGVSSGVRGVINCVGPTNMTYYTDPRRVEGSPYKKEFIKSMELLVPDPAGDHTLQAWEMSPLKFVHRGAPPHLNMYGGSDVIVMSSQGEEYHKALTEAGVKSRLLIVEDKGHT